MTVRWTVREEAGTFRGLEITTQRRSPSVRLEVAGWGQLKLTSAAGPVFWARSDGYETWARVIDPQTRVQIVPKISAPQVRAVKAEPGSDDWWKAWAKHFAAGLEESSDTPLYPKDWWLEPARPRRVRRPWWDATIPQPMGWQAAAQELGVREEEALGVNQVIALRRPSSPQSDRVKVWRKHARTGTLPPVLLWYLPAGLDVFLVLDGHDRLQAAAREKVEPRFLLLAHAARAEQTPLPPHNLEMMMRGIQQRLDRQPRDVPKFNEMLIDAHRTSSRHLSARGWPLKGKGRAWEKEVRAVSAELGIVPEIIGLLQARP